MTKRLLVIAVGVMTTLLALAALWQFRIVVIYLLISWLVAATFRPVLQHRSLRYRPTRIRLILQYVVGILAFLFLFVLSGRYLVGDFQQLVESLTEDTNWSLPAWLQGDASQRAAASWLPTPNQVLDALTSQRELLLSAVLGFTEGLGGLLSGLAVVLFLSVYWSMNQNHFERLWLSLLPADVRKRARFISRAIENDLGAYTRSELIQSLFAVVLLGLGYWLFGSPYPTLLAVTGAIARLIPVVGATLALVLPLLLGLLESPQLALSTALYTAIVLVFLQVWVEPRFFKLNKDNPVLTFVILLAMADAFGLLGIIAAPPVSLICQTLWRFLVAERVSPDTTSQVADLRERQARLQAAVESMSGSPPPLVISSMERLNDLIQKSEPFLNGKEKEEPADIFRLP